MSASGAGAFRRDFITDVAPQCRAFSRALKWKVKSPELSATPMGPGIQLTGALF